MHLVFGREPIDIQIGHVGTLALQDCHQVLVIVTINPMVPYHMFIIAHVGTQINITIGARHICRSGRNCSTGQVVGDIGLKFFLKVRYDDANDRHPKIHF